MGCSSNSIEDDLAGRDLSHQACERRVDDGSEGFLRQCAQGLTGGDTVAGFHERLIGRACALFQRQHHPPGRKHAFLSGAARSYCRMCNLFIKDLIGTRRPSRMGCGFTVVEPDHFRFAFSISALD